MSSKVLIIDDNKGDMVLVREFLQDTKLDYQIMWVEHGAEGIKIAKEESPEVVFLDVLMPGLGGYTVCEELKMLNKKIYVIMMTGASWIAEGERHAKSHGSDGFCLKTPESILKALLSYHAQKIASKDLMKKKRIMLVEDNPGDKKLMQETLAELGIEYKLFEMNSAERIMDSVLETQPDIIFMDVMMPGVSGGDAVRLLRHNFKTMNIPVVFLTGVWSKEDQMDSSRGINIEGQVYPTLAKPIDSKMLKEVMDKACPKS